MSPVIDLPPHLEIRRPVPGAGRTIAGYDRLRGLDVAVKWAAGTSQMRSLRREWLLLHDLIRSEFPEPLEFGHAGDETAWMTTRWFEADPLDILRGNCDASVAMQVARKALGSLASLHRAGLAHGDINPHNILIRHQSGAWDVKLVDLEFAAELDRLSAGFLITDQGPGVERAEGGAWSPRDDLRSFGLILRKIVPDAGAGRPGDSPLQRFAERLCDDYYLQAYGNALDALLDLEDMAEAAGVPLPALDPLPGPAVMIRRHAALRKWGDIRERWQTTGRTLLLKLSGARGVGKRTFLRRQLAELAAGGHAVFDLTRTPAPIADWYRAAPLLREYLKSSTTPPAVMLSASDARSPCADLFEMLPEGSLVVAVMQGSPDREEADVPASWRVENWVFPGPTAMEWHRWIAASV